MNEPQSEPSEVEKLLGFRVQNGMVWMDGKFYTGWTIPRIDHMQKAVIIIERLIKQTKEK